MRSLAHVALLACLALALPMTARSQKTAATTSEGEQILRELVRVMNTRDHAQIRRFVDERFVNGGSGGVPPEERVERLSRIVANLGRQALRSVDAAKPREVVALTQSERTESWSRMTVFLNEASPARILRVGFFPAPAPDAPTQRPSDAELVAQLKAYVERLASRDVFSGTVLLAKKGVPLYQAAFGEANKDFGVKNTLDTKFNLGSMNKMFTAVSVMQLVEAGKLSLDDTLGKFLPAGAMKPDVLAKVRVKHLLSHTSGLGSYFTPEWDRQSRALWRSVNDWMALIKDDTLQFEPGTRWSYSNTGMLVLGKVIEVVTKQDYFTYVREHLYKPAGMMSTDAYQLDEVNKNLAVGYEPEFAEDGTKRFKNNIFMHVIRGGPAGGGYSTAEDLVRFAESLKSGKLVSPATYELLTTPKPDVNSPQYGYGFGVGPQTGIVGHSGGFPGISSNLDIFKGSGYVAVVMSNYGGASQPIVEKIRALVQSRTAATPAQ
jgi:CubicO group peptidase (beta-lactamase class C family)